MKLDRDDVTRMCQRVVDHNLDTGLVADQFEISRRRVQQFAKEYCDSGEIPQLETPAAPPMQRIPTTSRSHITASTPFQSVALLGRVREDWEAPVPISEVITDYGSEFTNMHQDEGPCLDRNELETPADAFDRLLPSPQNDFDDPLATEVSTDE